MQSAHCVLPRNRESLVPRELKSNPLIASTRSTQTLGTLVGAAAPATAPAMEALVSASPPRFVALSTAWRTSLQWTPSAMPSDATSRPLRLWHVLRPNTRAKRTASPFASRVWSHLSLIVSLTLPSESGIQSPAASTASNTNATTASARYPSIVEHTAAATATALSSPPGSPWVSVLTFRTSCTSADTSPGVRTMPIGPTRIAAPGPRPRGLK